MKTPTIGNWVIATCWLLMALGVAQAQIHVDAARIGCLDIQKDPNLTGIVGNACNGQYSCSFKAPTEQQYRSAGVEARTRTFCTQGMEIVYRCGNAGDHTVSVPGDAWTKPPADLECPRPITSGGGMSGEGTSGGSSRIQFPIQRSQHDPINGIGYMDTTITIFRNGDGSGQLSASTHMWSEKDLEGFHGSVAVAALDRNQRLVWVSATQSYGVGSKVCIGNCDSDRTDRWSDIIPAQALSNTVYLAIKQRYAPKSASINDIGNWLQGLGHDAGHELESILQAIGNALDDDHAIVFPPEPPCPSGPNHLYVVTLGDSIMWGQGLPYQSKFRTQVTAWLQNQIGASRQVCQIPTRAHSGGQLQVSAEEGDTETGLPGEIPSGHPSISLQLQLTLNDLRAAHIDPNEVGLVLMDGGINDVGVTTIINPRESTGNLVQQTQQSMHTLDPLLRSLLSTFPKAAVVITGYYAIASNNSDVKALLDFAGVVLDSPGVGNTPRIVENSQVFVTTIHQQIAQIVAGIPAPYRARLALAVPNFQSINAYGARDTFLWRIEDFVGPEADGLIDVDPLPPLTPNGVAWSRARACSVADRPSPKCLDASMGHPNLKGANAYTEAIVSAIRQPQLWAFIALSAPGAGPANTPPRPPVITAVFPLRGPITGGTSVQVSVAGGTAAGTAVSFNGATPPQARCENNNCWFTTPPFTKPGPVNIVVTVPGASAIAARMSSRPSPFTYTPNPELASFGRDPSSSDVRAYLLSLDGNAPATGALIELQSKNPNVVSVPQTVNVRGASARVLLTFLPVAKDELVTLTATYQGKSIPVTVNAPAWPSISISIAPGNINRQAMVTVKLGTPAPAGGAAVTLSSSDPAIIADARNSIAPGGYVTTFPIVARFAGDTVNGRIAIPGKRVTLTAKYSYNGASTSISTGLPFYEAGCPAGTAECALGR